MNVGTKRLEAFLLEGTNFITKLRNLEGLDKSSSKVLMDILDEIGAEIADVALIEKKLAFLLVEIEPALSVVTDYYEGDLRQSILDEIAQISMKINSILTC